MISTFGRVLNVLRFVFGDSPASEIHIPTFRNTLFHLHRQVSACTFYTYPSVYEDGTDRVFRNV